MWGIRRRGENKRWDLAIFTRDKKIVADKIWSNVGLPFRESVRWRQIGNERAVWEHLTPCIWAEMGIVSLKMSFP